MSSTRLKLLYDGDCPFCRREVEWLKRRDRCDQLVVENIAAIGFDPRRYGLTQAEVMGSLHGILPDGHVVRGMEAIRRAYAAVGLAWLAAPTRLPIVRPLFDGMYAMFAHNRVRLGRLFGRKCESGACAMKTPLSRKTTASNHH